MKRFILDMPAPIITILICTILGLVVILLPITSCSSTSADVPKKGDIGHFPSLHIGDTPAIQNGTGFWASTSISLFTYTGILNGSLVITSVNWENAGNTSIHPVMYIPKSQTSFNIHSAYGRSFYIYNIVIEDDGSLTFDWKMTSDGH